MILAFVFAPITLEPVRQRGPEKAMATLVGKQRSLGDLLNALIELDYDAAAAYEAAIERLESQAYKDTMSEFLEDHRRHIVELTPHAAKLRKDVADEPDLKSVLTKGKVIIANLAGDKAILTAMKTNEDDTVTAYERALGHQQLTEDLLPLIERNLGDEHRHRNWLMQTLGISEEERPMPKEPATTGAGAREMTGDVDAPQSPLRPGR